MAADFFSRLIANKNIRSDEALRGLLLKNDNFEDALFAVRTQGYAPNQVSVFEEAVLDVFLDHDYAIRKARFSSQAEINIYGVQEFVSRFCNRRAGADTGYFFTLNQDLWLERKYYNYTPYYDALRPTLPGVVPHRDWFLHLDDSWNGLPPDYVRTVAGASTIPDSDWPPKLARQFNYLKLHGSFDWRDSNGQALLVIGGRKRNSIATSPLLNWYSQVFQAVCSAGDVRLFVSGYGFRDDHINEILAAGIREAGLKIFIHNTTPAHSLRAQLSEVPAGDVIWSGLIGYSAKSLIEVFPGTQNLTEERQYIESVLFS